MEDYVLFKLDVDETSIERSHVSWMLNSSNYLNDVSQHVAEFLWEHHQHDNSVMSFPSMGRIWRNDKIGWESLEHSYAVFLRFRLLGVRAHGWV